MKHLIFVAFVVLFLSLGTSPASAEWEDTCGMKPDTPTKTLAPTTDASMLGTFRGTWSFWAESMCSAFIFLSITTPQEKEGSPNGIGEIHLIYFAGKNPDGTPPLQMELKLPLKGEPGKWRFAMFMKPCQTQVFHWVRDDITALGCPNVGTTAKAHFNRVRW